MLCVPAGVRSRINARTWSILTPNADRGQLATASTIRTEKGLNCTTQIQAPFIDLGIGQPLVFIRKLEGFGGDLRAPSQAGTMGTRRHTTEENLV